MYKDIYLLTGSNLGDRKSHLETACRLLDGFGITQVAVSALYETASWGIAGQPNYYNQVLKIQTTLGPVDLLRTLQAVEAQMGRTREIKWESRVIDIDILFFGHEIIKEDFLTIPHPEIQNRRFTLVPMCDLAPEFMHPVLKKTTRELLESCTDDLAVKTAG